MELTVVGCAGSFPSADSACSSYLVVHDGYRIVIDLGFGALGALQRHLDPREVDVVLISHLHLDHCVDLCAYYVVRRYDPDGALPLLPVYGPDGTRALLDYAHGIADDGHADRSLASAFEFRALRKGAFEVGPFLVEAARTVHPVETYALRLTAGGRSLVYSADTGECDELVALARDADLFLCEASFTEGREDPGIHLTGRQAGEHARRAAVRRLMLTHIPAWTDAQANLAAADAAFGGPTMLAAPGAVVTV